MMDISEEKMITHALKKTSLHAVPIEIRKPQTKLTAREREVVRGNSKLASAIFEIDFIPIKPDEYYYWDNTTLSLWEYLGSILPNLSPNAIITELGCGPYATLSIAVKKHYPQLNVSASDIIHDRVLSAQRMVRKNQVDMLVKQLDLLSNIDQNVDLIFMNPPYVSTYQQEKISSSKRKNLKEWQSGNGGINGTEVVKKLLKDFSRIRWKKDVILLLGINNYFINDEKILSMVENASLRVEGYFKPKKLCIPSGSYAQVYQIK